MLQYRAYDFLHTVCVCAHRHAATMQPQAADPGSRVVNIDASKVGLSQCSSPLHSLLSFNNMQHGNISGSHKLKLLGILVAAFKLKGKFSGKSRQILLAQNLQNMTKGPFVSLAFRHQFPKNWAWNSYLSLCNAALMCVVIGRRSRVLSWVVSWESCMCRVPAMTREMTFWTSWTAHSDTWWWLCQLDLFITDNNIDQLWKTPSHQGLNKSYGSSDIN